MRVTVTTRRVVGSSRAARRRLRLRRVDADGVELAAVGGPRMITSAGVKRVRPANRGATRVAVGVGGSDAGGVGDGVIDEAGSADAAGGAVAGEAARGAGETRRARTMTRRGVTVSMRVRVDARVVCAVCGAILLSSCGVCVCVCEGVEGRRARERARRGAA